MKDATKRLDLLFNQLKIKADIIDCFIEGSFLIFNIVLKPSGIFKKLEQYSTEIALTLKALSEPLIYTITEKGIIRIELNISKQEDVHFNDLIPFLDNSKKLPLILGKCRDGSPLMIDLYDLPHLLVGGQTGSGKSILLQVIVNNFLLSNKNIKFALIDTKRVEFNYYDNIRLFAPVAKNIEESLNLLQNLIDEMEIRFKLLEKQKARNILSYKGNMPYIIIIIDELADLMSVSKKDTQNYICRLAQKSRACGIHLIVATQRPSTNVVTGLIKANFNARIAFKVSSSIDSRVLFDKNGAERLSGRGDAILNCNNYPFTRFKASYISEEQIISNVKNKSNWWTKLWI